MRIDFKGLNNYVIEPEFADHARPRLEGLEHLSSRLRDCRVAVELQRGRFTVEITCDVDGLVLRSETVDNDLMDAFDEAFEKVERRLTRHKSKLVRRRKQGTHRGEEPLPAGAVAPEEAVDDETEELEDFHIARGQREMPVPRCVAVLLGYELAESR